MGRAEQNPIGVRVALEAFCILCRKPIPENRKRRGAVTCCPDHAREYRCQRRAERSLRFCRLCGRPAKRTKPSGPVLHEHSGILEAVRPKPEEIGSEADERGEIMKAN